MKKRLFSFLLVLICVCSFSLSAFAKSIDDITADDAAQITANPYLWYAQNQMLGVEKGTGVTLVCPNGDYKTLYTGGTLVTCPYDGEALELASAGGVTAKKIPEGIGRKDIIGYADNEGHPNVISSGIEVLWVEPFGISGSLGSGFYSSAPANLIAGASASGTQYFNTSLATVVYYFVAPVSGLYYLGFAGSPYDFGVFNYFSSDTWKSIKIGLSLSNAYSVSRSLNKGDKIYYCYTFSGASVGYGISLKPYKFNLNKIPIFIEPLGDSAINNYNKITINNNNWNGNIYVDNSNNLTYIYPQYTTINENNETVTNISTNPIIYNNETKQYYTYDQTTKNYYYITYNAPSPSPTPAPTWTPGGGATRGGGVGRHPSDTDAADWTLHYYILNNRRYDAYYALKKTEVDTDTKLPWVYNKKYISTTQIPIANGQYTVSVPDGVYWRVWQWDEASQTLTGVNSSNWHSTINNFLFNATGEYIFEFCKADGSDFDTAKDVTLKLKNDKITDYEDGGTIVEEPTPSPSPEPTETPSPTDPPTPTATPTPGGGTVPTPGGDSGGGNSGSSDSGWNPFKWLTDLLKDIVETILKGLWKLLTSIFGFILWLVSLLFKLFPWMPNSGILALCAGVVVVTVIRIIKFITGR